MSEELAPPPKSAKLPRKSKLVMQGYHLDSSPTPHSSPQLDNQPSDSADCHQDDIRDLKEPASTQHQRIERSSNAFSLQFKYGLSDDGMNRNHISGHVLHDLAKHTEHHEIDAEITLPHHDDQIMKGTNRKLPMRAKYNYLITDNHPVNHDEHNRHVEHYADNAPLSHHEVFTSTEHQSKRGGKIAASTLQAARAQAAELRALHSAVLNSHLSLGTDAQRIVSTQSFMPTTNHLAQYKKGGNKESKVHKAHISGGGKERRDDVQGALSSASSASSTADCFIRPAHEYPVFMPHYQEDMLLNTSVDDANSSHRRSSVDTYETAMLREERLQYIFDHDNKRSFSSTNFDDPYAHENSISCLHESLNLPPRSASAALMHLRDNNDEHQLHHMSLDLPRGSQHYLFKSSTHNPLFDSRSMHIKKESSHRLDDHGTACALSFNTYHDDLQGKPIKGNKADKYSDAHEPSLQDFSSRQRALIEFLSEEPARMRAFNELAAKEAGPSSDLHSSIRGVTTPKQKIIQEDIVLPSSTKYSDKFESPAWNVDQSQGSGGQQHHHHHHNHSYQNIHKPNISSTPQMRQRLAHTSNNGHFSVSCNECRPAGGVPTFVVPLPDSSEIGTMNSSMGTGIKDRPEQQMKKPSIKDWFFRGKKKQNQADLPNNSSNPPSDPSTSRNRTPVTSSTFSVSKEKQSTSTSTTSHVFSGLATSETEKELEVAMAMDLMELKVLQANTKRDAAMAEVLELRLAMDSMAKKLVEVERHCESLQAQLLNVKALHLGVDRNGASPASRKFDNAVDRWAEAEEDDETATAPDHGHGRCSGALTDGDDDFCESDSHDNREERKADPSKMRAGLNMQCSGYGVLRNGRSRRMAQPKKEEFMSAVAEARVGVKQVSRVVLQHVQESMGRGLMMVEMEDGGEAQRWRPVMMMCREASGRAETKGSSREVGYCIEALISLAFYEHFENVGFDKNGAHHILDPAQRALAFYHSFIKLAKLTPSQLLTQSSALYNPAFDRFCSRKMRALGRAVGCPGRLWPDELARSFLSAARAVWLLHQLDFAFPASPPAIFRVAAQSPFDARFMELLPTHHRPNLPQPAQTFVSLMVIPGFFLSDDVIKCKVLA